jgi:lipopolysaccharide/colanic/teichoic acid biosynthesis glycosyltransferase
LSTINLGPFENPFGMRQSAARISARETAERIAGACLLAVTAPVIAISAATVAVLSGRSPFIAHRRVGQYGTPFWTLKLRTMWDRCGLNRSDTGWLEYVTEEPEDNSKNNSDPRVSSRIAVFLRRHSIDELPQLWHVVSGEMSLVGPRPLTRSEVIRHYGSDAIELLSVKPGLTGLWQVHGRSAIRFPERSAMDLSLVRSLTPGLYLRILLRTVPALILGSGAW